MFRRLLLAASLALFSCTTVTPPAERIAAPVHVVLAQTTDLHGWIDGHPESTAPPRNEKFRSGGADVLASYLERLREENPGGVVLVDSGDLFQGTLESNTFEGEPVVKLYNALGYDAAAIGNHEFDFGPVGPKASPSEPGDDPLGALKKNISMAKFPFLSANVREKATGARPAWLKPYVIVDRAGARIGIIGASTEDTPTTTLPANVATLSFTDGATEIREAAAELRRQNVDAVVLIAHIGGECSDTTNPHEPANCKPDTAIARVANSLAPGTVDVIFGGHTHFAVRQTINGIPVAQAAALGRGLAIVDVWIDRGKHAVLSERSAIRPLVTICEQVFDATGDCNSRKPAGTLVKATFDSATITPDSAVRRVMQPYLDTIAAKKRERLGITVAAPFGRDYNRESALGDLIADALRADVAGADIGIVNSGGLRADLRGPDVTFGEMFEILPFDNFVSRLRLTGRELQQLFEITAGSEHGALQVSGLKVIADTTTKPPTVKLFKSDGTPIDPSATYTVATIDFLAAGGGGLGPVMKNLGPERKEVSTRLIRDAAITQLKARAASGPLQPKIEGRLEIRGGS